MIGTLALRTHSPDARVELWYYPVVITRMLYISHAILLIPLW